MDGAEPLLSQGVKLGFERGAERSRDPEREYAFNRHA